MTARTSEQRLRERANERRYRQRHPKRVWLAAIRKRARKFGIPFDLTTADVTIPDECPVTGVPLKFGGRSFRERMNSPSLDRLHPERGYVKGNVIVVSNLANCIRGLATPEQIARAASFYGQLME